jgi:hypothetical protein
METTEGSSGGHKTESNSEYNLPNLDKNKSSFLFF